MNWKKLLFTVAGSALAGGGAIAGTVPAGSTDWTHVGLGALMSAITGLLGFIQQPNTK